MMNCRTVCVTLLLLLSSVKCEYPFRNVSLSFEARVDDLIHRLTVDELAQQMSRGGGGGDGEPAPPIPRLGIDVYSWGTECIHGDAHGKSTSFPQSIGLAAAFNPVLIRDLATAVSTEVRAINNEFVKTHVDSGHVGLNCFSPVINIMRHPLWGRNQETYGEDPYLSGVYAFHFAHGLMGDNSRYYRANSVCKHFDAYGGPEDLPQSRLSFNAQVPERDLFTTYLPQFKACLQGGALGVMCSYNSVNGVPSCVNKRLLTGILREMWNFTGFVISDSGAVEFIIVNHRYIQNIEDTAVACVEAGLNLELHAGSYGRGVYDWLPKVVNNGRLKKEQLVERVRPLFYTRMRLGEFDPPAMNPYTSLNLSVIQSYPHRQLATLAAMQSFVLLKNDGVLPIKEVFQTVAIIGPFANNSDQQTGSYAPEIDPRYTTTVYTGLSPLGHQTLLVPGCTDTKCLDYNDTAVKQAVKSADVTVVCLGTGTAVETEGFDRSDMLLPGYQETLLKDVIQNTQGKIVVLVFSGGPVNMHLAQTHPAVSAIIQCFFPGQATGAALYRTLINKGPESSPAGRLPYTWYASDQQVPAMTDYSMYNRTYRYFNGVPLYPFGYGLSYTQFQYNSLVLVPTRVKAGQNVTAQFTITNTGPVSGAEVYQVYISWLNATVPTPMYQLVGFNRTMLSQGQTKTFSATITSDVMAVWKDDHSGFIIEPGDIAVYVGGQMPNQKVAVPSNVLRAVFTVYS